MRGLRLRSAFSAAALAAGAAVVLAMVAGQGTVRADASSKASRQLQAKLDQIQANDQAILAKVDAILQELQIVKLRVLRRPTVPPP
jgi:hypothetical protein